MLKVPGVEGLKVGGVDAPKLMVGFADDVVKLNPVAAANKTIACIIDVKIDKQNRRERERKKHRFSLRHATGSSNNSTMRRA